MSEIRCGLIGYSLGWEQHGRRHGTYINSTDGMKLAAVCDVNPEATAKARRDFPGIKTFQTPERLLADGEIDLVSILTPHYLHYPLALAALNAGKHVVVEKPLCFTVEQADALFEAANARGRTVATFFNRRRDGNFLAIQEIVRSGEIGDLREVRLVSESRGLHGTSWRNMKSKSGGTPLQLPGRPRVRLDFAAARGAADPTRHRRAGRGAGLRSQRTAHSRLVAFRFRRAGRRHHFEDVSHRATSLANLRNHGNYRRHRKERHRELSLSVSRDGGSSRIVHRSQARRGASRRASGEVFRFRLGQVLFRSGIALGRRRA